MDSAPVRDYLTALQAKIVVALEKLDGGTFATDAWQRPEGGGGVTRVIEEGRLFERGGVNFSHVMGEKLPPSASASRPQLAAQLGEQRFEAMGVSLVLHPRSPHCPTVHMNLRFFAAGATWWFGGGMDLTPYYGVEEDARHFHATCKRALEPFGAGIYPKYKKWCDEYFFLKHRNEPRGVGGIFFDDLAEPEFDGAFALVRSVGDHFLTAYGTIIERRRAQTWTDAERAFQCYRRGRYVEFNLVHDRGTLFGLQSGGRTESILMSLPPAVTWRYNWTPSPGSPEENLYKSFLKPRDWV